MEDNMNMQTNDNVTTGIRRARGQQLGDLLRRSASRTPNKLALAFRDHRDTFRDLDEAVNRTANALAAAGITKGERVALLSRNSRAFVILRFAIARIGAVTTPVNFMLNAEDVAYILDHSGACALICEDSLCPTAEAALDLVKSRPRLLYAIDHSGAAVSSTTASSGAAASAAASTAAGASSWSSRTSRSSMARPTASMSGTRPRASPTRASRATTATA